MIDTTQTGPELSSCTHTPRCPDSSTTGACRACVVARHDEQGWCLLCNGVVLFDDGGAILPDGNVLAPATRAA